MERTFGEIIKKERNNRSWSVRDLITKLAQLGTEISPAYITKIEVHGEIPKPELMFKMADLFELDQQDLWESAKRNKLQSVEKVLDRKYETAIRLYRIQKGK